MSGIDHLSGPLEFRKEKRYQLVLMPLNHFGEKARFILDLIDAPYEEVNIFGILCIFLRGRSIPWLIDKKSCSCIGNSDQILSYMNAEHVPTMTKEKRVAAEILLRRTDATISWEEKLNGLGHAVQGYAYYYVLHKDSSIDFPLATWGGFEPHVPFEQRFLLRLTTPVLKIAMRGVFALDDENLRDTRRKLITNCWDDIDEALKQNGGPYIMGKDMTYIDITFATLMYPMLSCMMSPMSKWANGRFTSFLQYEGESPHTKFKELHEFEEELKKRPCGMLLQRVYDRRGTRL